MKLRFGRRVAMPGMPFSGRYLTRLIIFAGCCVFATITLSLPRWRAKAAARQQRGPNPDVVTALAPSPFGELGMDVIVADGRPRQSEVPPDAPTAVQPAPDELPRVDVRLLENVLDKTKELYQRPYYHLVTIAAQARPDLLEQGARRDLTYLDLWNEPEKYRAQIVYLQGHVRGLVPLTPTTDEYFNPAKVPTLYEGHMITPDSRLNPYVIIVPHVPAGMPTGANVVENVTFAGYFFKLWQYKAGDNTERAAPLLIGRMLTWTPAPPHDRNKYLSTYLAASFVFLFICIGGAMWALNRRTRSIAAAADRGEQSAQTTMLDLSRLEEIDIPDPIDELQKEQEP